MEVYYSFFILFICFFFEVQGLEPGRILLYLTSSEDQPSNFTFRHKTQDHTNIVMLKGRKHLQVNKPPSKNIRLKQGVHQHCGGTGHVQAYSPNIPEGRKTTWDLEEQCR